MNYKNFTLITADSRKVIPGALFVAVKGYASDGHDYIQSAIDKGATGIICERIPEEDTLRGACPPPDEHRGRGPLDTSPEGTQETMGGAGMERSGMESPGRESLPTSASSRINVADTSALGLPEAVIRIVCSKGTYIRAFARDLGEALGSGAHLSGLIRSRSGDFRVEDALSLDQALALFQGNS